MLLTLRGSRFSTSHQIETDISSSEWRFLLLNDQSNDQSKNVNRLTIIGISLSSDWWQRLMTFIKQKPDYIPEILSFFIFILSFFSFSFSFFTTLNNRRFRFFRFDIKYTFKTFEQLIKNYHRITIGLSTRACSYLGPAAIKSTARTHLQFLSTRRNKDRD